MRLMHRVEKQELKHHFLGIAGRAGSRPTCRRPIRSQRRGAPQRRNKGQRGTEHHAHPAVSPSAPKGVVPRDEGTRVSGERSTTPTRRSAHPPLETWCPATKEQGLAGSEAPHPTCRRPIRPQRRGAQRRRNKDQRGTEHHAHPAVSPSAPKGVVPRDEGTRVSGERSTTPTRRSAHPPLETWCPATKEQGLAGSEASHPTCRRPIRPQRRGAP